MKFHFDGEYKCLIKLLGNEDNLNILLSNVDVRLDPKPTEIIVGFHIGVPDMPCGNIMVNIVEDGNDIQVKLKGEQLRGNEDDILNIFFIPVNVKILSTTADSTLYSLGLDTAFNVLDFNSISDVEIELD